MFCVVDNDFSAEQFPAPSVSGLPALQVTMAHEFFHAIQAAYDFSNEERWLKEGTAVWIEDEVFDDVNANYGYLVESPLHQPEISLDALQDGGDAQDFEYGSWIFWRFLSEYYGTREVIKEVWERVAEGTGGDLTAVQALEEVLPRKDPNDDRCFLYCTETSFRRVFSEFAFWNLSFPDIYEEGLGYFEVLKGRLAPLDAEYLLDPNGTTAVAGQVLADHLSSHSLVLYLDPNSTTQIELDFPDLERGTEAFFLVVFPDGTGDWSTDLRFDPSGNTTRFVSGVVRLYVLFQNASHQFDGEPYAYRMELVA